MFCTNCGQKAPDGSKFCTNCGTRLMEPVAPPPQDPAPAAPAPIPAPVTPPMPTPAPMAPPMPTPTPVVPPMPTPAPVAPPMPTPTPVVPPAPKPKKKNGAVAAIAVILVVALIAVAGWFAWQHLGGNEDPEPGTTKTAQATQATEPSTEPSTESVPPLELTITPAQLVYEMTEADVEKFYELLEQCEELALSNEDSDTVMDVSDALDDQFEYMDAQSSIAMVLYYCDLKDEDASQLYLDCTSTLTQAYNEYMEMSKRLYEADFPAKEAFFEEWTEQDLAMLKAYTPEVMELEQRNSEIEVAYQDMQDSETMYEDMVPLYLEMVQNNNRIAQIYGYDNYYTYAYDMVYDRDYDSEEIAQMRAYISTYMPDAIQGSMDGFLSSMEELNRAEQLNLSAFLMNSFEDIYEDEIAEYLQSLPTSAGETMLAMFDGDIVMMDNADNAIEGAFTTTIGEDRSLCFFGPGYSNALTAVHEVGHYYGSKYASLNELPLDLAETHSQGNEWLFMAFLKDTMGSDKLYQAAVDYKTYSDLATIMICVIVDEFEQQVYSHPYVSSLTCEDLDAIMEQVCEKYGGIDFLGTVVTDIQDYWRMVVIEQPVYYISYGVSALAAIDLFHVAQENYSLAVDAYCSLIENVDLESGFLGNIGAAGLDGPFDEEVYRALSELYAN